MSVAREISKIHEEHVRGTLDEVIAHFEETEPKGEIVIVLAGKPKPGRASVAANSPEGE